MKFLVVGLGSMGKRRIRCLKALSQPHIFGFDTRQDRAEEAKNKYGVPVFSSFEEAISAARPDALVISVPPDRHIDYIRYAIEHDTHFFVEASVVDEGLEGAIVSLKGRKIVAAPSTTMVFHPAIKKITSIVRSGTLGKLSNVILHSGQYLPDWHTYEHVRDYYVSNPATGGGREIVPFELTWFVRTFGSPHRVCANFRKTIEIEGAEYIDDTYNMLFDYGTYLAAVTVDVVSRFATRRLVINGARKQLYWSWEENRIKVYDPAVGEWEEIEYERPAAEKGYNVNIGESMYIEELASFVDAVEGRRPYPGTLEEDHKVLKLLYSCERSDRLSRFVEV